MTTFSPESGALRDLSTPCLVVDGAVLQRNIDAMAATVRKAGVALRPHAKTHKSPDIAALQLRAGAGGIACATVGEAEAMTAAGIGGLLLTAPSMGADKFARLAKLNRAQAMTMAVDHPAQVEALLAALQDGDGPFGVVIDIDVGHGRTGIIDMAMGVELARTIAARPQLRFAGIQGYAGHAQHIPDPTERIAAVDYAKTTLRQFAKTLSEAGLPPPLITGSGTGTHRLDAEGPYTELQPGSYVFMDADYAAIKDAQGNGPPFMPSLFVLATVVSVNRPGEVTVDAGTKALATNGPPPCVIFGLAPGATYRFAGDEHGIIAIPPGQQAPALGARLLIGATHCDPTVNLHAAYHVMRDGRIEQWPIRGRYGD